MTEEKFLELVRKHQTQVYRHALYLVGNPEDAEDITQDTFIRAWEHRAKLRAKTVHSWLLKCAQNLCFNRLKRRKFQLPLAAGDDEELETLMHTHSGEVSPSPEELLLKKELKQVVQQAIRQLPPDTQRMVMMRELDGMSFKEIAEILQQPEGTVKSTVFRARKKLRELLSPYWRMNE